MKKEIIIIKNLKKQAVPKWQYKDPFASKFYYEIKK